MAQSLQESMEAIAFQTNSDYPKRLISLFQEALDNASRIDLLDKALYKIFDQTMKTIGIWMEPKITQGDFVGGKYRVEVDAPNINTFTPLNKRAVERMKTLDLENFDVEEILNGFIDLKHARVGGVFSELKHYFQISIEMFDGSFDAEDLTAIYLHETGHAYTLILFMSQTLITNTILAEVVGQIDSESVIERKLWLGQAAIKLSGGSDKIDKPIDVATAAAVVIKNEPLRIQNRIGSRWYDSRLAEAVADQFAARWMMGASMVKALGKMERKRNILFSTSGYDPIWVGITANALNIAMFPFSALKGSLLTATLTVLKSYAVSTGLSFGLQGVMDLIVGKSYDSPQDRSAAIRREIVTLLKNPKLPDKTRHQALADLKVIDEELAKVHNYGDVIAKLGQWLYRGISGREDELGFHKTHESLANNRLYELAAYLKG